MRALFVMDPIGSVRIDLDSTFAIMLEAQERGHEVLYCLVTDLCLEHDRPSARVRPVRLVPLQGSHAELGAPLEMGLRDIDVIFMRKDPPFDMEYIFATYLLEAAEPHTLVLNRPASLRDHNEKLYALQFPEFCPESLVSSRKEKIAAFHERVGAIVVKPLDGNGGEGIFILQPGDPNRNVIVETSTRHGRRPVLAQRYLPEARQGDKRILLVDGRFEGAVLRVPTGADPRGNLHVGAVKQKTTLTQREEALVAALGPRLRAAGHLFVGIDVIGEHLTEVNVTSPTGIHEIDALDGTRVAARVVDGMERWLEAHRAERAQATPAPGRNG